MKRLITGALAAVLSVAGAAVSLPAQAAGSVRVNEVTCTGADWIELYNPTDTPVDISNWVLSDRESGGTLRHQFAIPRATTLQPGKFIVFEQGTLSNQLTFGIDCSAGETIYLFSTMSPTAVLVDSLVMPPAIAGFSYGRISATASGHTLATKGGANKDGKPSLTSPSTLKCKAKTPCKFSLKLTNGGKAALAKKLTGVQLTGNVLKLTARAKQTMKIVIKASNAAGTKAITLTVKIA